MKLSIRIATLIAFLAFAFTAEQANAEPEHEIVRGELTVQVTGGGKITGTRIDCGTDCYDTETWADNELPPKNRLTATPNTGWAFGGWQGCTSVNGQSNKCDASYSEFGGNTVTASFYDVMAPSVFLHYPANDAVIGNSAYAAVETGDNDRVVKVEYLLDGQVIATSTTGQFDMDLDFSGVSEGTHQFQARSYDPTGNNGITGARTITVDHTAPEVSLTSPLTATNATRPQFSFTSSSSDVKEIGCAIIKKGDDATYVPCNAGEWFAGDAPTEGDWQFTVWAVDKVGNLNQVIHDFVVDRTAPEAAFTSGPADGSVVKVGNVSYAWNATDDLPLSQVCSWDSGEETACDGSAARGLAAGTHSFKVVVTDQAGNSTTLSRSVTVKKDGDVKDPDPDPDTSDKTAPVVKLIAPKQTVKTARKALRLKVRCNEACSGKVVVKGKGAVKFAGRVSLAKAGVAKLKLKPSAKVRRQLNAVLTRSLRTHRAQPLKLTATASLKDKAGNLGKFSLKFRVKG
jgi:hypothetical protein